MFHDIHVIAETGLSGILLYICVNTGADVWRCNSVLEHLLLLYSEDVVREKQAVATAWINREWDKIDVHDNESTTTIIEHEFCTPVLHRQEYVCLAVCIVEHGQSY